MERKRYQETEVEPLDSNDGVDFGLHAQDERKAPIYALNVCY